MLNLLHEIERSAFRVKKLRDQINELTAELNREEMTIAVHARQCIGLRELELSEEETRKAWAASQKGAQHG